MSKAEDVRSTGGAAGSGRRKNMLSFGMGLFSRKHNSSSGSAVGDSDMMDDTDQLLSKYGSESFNATTHVSEYYRSHAPESAPEHIADLERQRDDLGRTLKTHVHEQYTSYAQICKETDGSDSLITQLSQMLNSLQWHLVGLQKSDVLPDPKDVMSKVDGLLEQSASTFQPLQVKTALLVKFMEGEQVRQNGLYVVAALLCASNLRLLSTSFENTLLSNSIASSKTLFEAMADKEEEYLRRVQTSCLKICQLSGSHTSQLKRRSEKPVEQLASSTISRCITSTLLSADYTEYTAAKPAVDWRRFQKPVDSGAVEWRARSPLKAHLPASALVVGGGPLAEIDFGVSSWIPNHKPEPQPLRAALAKCLRVLRRTMRTMPLNSPDYFGAIWLQIYLGADDMAVDTHLHIISTTLHGSDSGADPSAWLQTLVSGLNAQVQAAFALDKAILAISPSILAKVLDWTYKSVAEVVQSISTKLKNFQNPFAEAAKAVKLQLLSVKEWHHQGLGVLAFTADACRSLLAGMVQERVSSQKKTVLERLAIDTFELHVGPMWPKTRVNFKGNLPPLHEAYVYHPMPPQVSASCRALIDGAVDLQTLITSLLEPQLRSECDLAAQISTALSDVLEGYITELVKTGKKHRGQATKEQFNIYFGCLANIYHTACGLTPTLLTQMSETLGGTVPTVLWDLFKKALKLYTLYWDMVSKTVAMTWIRAPVLEGSSSDNDAALLYLQNNIDQLKNRAVGILEWTDNSNLTGRYSTGTELTLASFEQPSVKQVSPRMTMLCTALFYVYNHLLVSLSPVASVLLTCDLALSCLKLQHEETGWKKLFPSTAGSQTIVVDVFTLAYFTMFLTDCDTLAASAVAPTTNNSSNNNNNTSATPTINEDITTLLPAQCKLARDQIMQFAQSQARRTGRIHAVSIEKSNEIPKKIIFDDEVYASVARKLLSHIRATNQTN